MKIGHKVLFTNGRGGCQPWRIMYGIPNTHGDSHGDKVTKKGLWSKIRHRAKLDIQKELTDDINNTNEG